MKRNPEVMASVSRDKGYKTCLGRKTRLSPDSPPTLPRLSRHSLIEFRLCSESRCLDLGSVSVIGPNSMALLLGRVPHSQISALFGPAPGTVTAPWPWPHHLPFPGPGLWRAEEASPCDCTRQPWGPARGAVGRGEACPPAGRAAGKCAPARARCGRKRKTSSRARLQLEIPGGPAGCRHVSSL